MGKTPILFLYNPSHSYCSLYVIHTVIGLPQYFGKFLPAEFQHLLADWEFAISTTQVEQITAHIICIIIVIEYLLQWRLVPNS